MVAAALFLGRGDGGVEDRGGAEKAGRTYGGRGGVRGSSSSQMRREMGSPAFGRGSSSTEGNIVPRDGRRNCLKRAKSPANSLVTAGIFEACVRTRKMGTRGYLASKNYPRSIPWCWVVPDGKAPSFPRSVSQPALSPLCAFLSGRGNQHTFCDVNRGREWTTTACRRRF